MWTRKELKDKAKASFKRNYWKTVLVAILAMSILGIGSASSASSITSHTARTNYSYDPNSVVVENGQATQDTLTEQDFIDLADELNEMGADPEVTPQELTQLVDELTEVGSAKEEAFAIFGVALVAFLVLLLVVFAIVLVVTALIYNPLYVGVSRFYLRNLNQPAEVKELAFGYDHNYRETVKALLWRDVRIILWGLLLIIPGIVKAYEYRMIPYLMAEDETMTTDRAFAESKRLMTGQKWHAFVLDLSFLGWWLLSVLTLGILAIFYVNPYKAMTDAALYEELRYGRSSDVRGDHFLKAPTTGAEPQVPVPPFASEDASDWSDEDASALGWDNE